MVKELISLAFHVIGLIISSLKVTEADPSSPGAIEAPHRLDCKLDTSALVQTLSKHSVAVLTCKTYEAALHQYSQFCIAFNVSAPFSCIRTVVYFVLISVFLILPVMLLSSVRI